MRKRMMWVGSLAIAGGVVLGACGGDEDPSVVGDDTETSSSSSEAEADSTDTSEAAATFNDADVTFAQSMIIHHEQAIEMARLASTRAESQDVLDLAARIEGAQQPEIDLMTEWLEAWGEEPAADMGMDGMDMGGMSEQQMTDLEATTGAQFDRMFLEMMIEHHQGAIEMANTETAEGENPEALELAAKIVADQTAEIEEMQAMLEQL